MTHLDVVHVGLYHFQSVLLNEGSDQAYALEVGGHLRLHVTQVVVQRSGAAYPWDLLLQVSRGHQQLCDALLLHHVLSVKSVMPFCNAMYTCMIALTKAMMQHGGRVAKGGGGGVCNDRVPSLVMVTIHITKG